MEKERVKKLICDYIDSVGEVQEVNMKEEFEEHDYSTLDRERIIRKPTGRIDIHIIAFEVE